MSSSSSTSLSAFLPAIPANALLYQRATINPIGVTPATATNIGYLAENKSQLEVVGELTGQDPTDIYSFTFQAGTNVSANIKNINETVGVHVQLLDGSGNRVLADNQGTSTQKDNFALWTSTKGLKLQAGQHYMIKVTYGNGASKTKAQDYTIQLGSGTTFQNDYRTLASPTTVANTLLAGGSIGYSSAATTASMLGNPSNGSSLNVFGGSIFSTNIFA